MLIDAVPTHGRNAQQITGAVGKQIKTYAKLLNEFTTTAKLEAALLVHVQARRPLLTMDTPFRERGHDASLEPEVSGPHVTPCAGQGTVVLAMRTESP